MNVDQKRDVIRGINAAVTATMEASGDRDVTAQVEACRLLDPTDVDTFGDLLEKYELTVSGLLVLASVMVELSGNLQKLKTGEELLQAIALGLEERWLQ